MYMVKKLYSNEIQTTNNLNISKTETKTKIKKETFQK